MNSTLNRRSRLTHPLLSTQPRRAGVDGRRIYGRVLVGAEPAEVQGEAGRDRGGVGGLRAETPFVGQQGHDRVHGGCQEWQSPQRTEGGPHQTACCDRRDDDDHGQAPVMVAPPGWTVAPVHPRPPIHDRPGHRPHRHPDTEAGGRHHGRGERIGDPHPGGGQENQEGDRGAAQTEERNPPRITDITGDIAEVSTALFARLRPRRWQQGVGRPCGRLPGVHGTAGLAMAFKLIEAGQDRRRPVDSPHLVVWWALAPHRQRPPGRTTRGRHGRTAATSSTGLDDFSGSGHRRATLGRRDGHRRHGQEHEQDSGRVAQRTAVPGPLEKNAPYQPSRRELIHHDRTPASAKATPTHVKDVAPH
jgi:hypothetical protein